ncbi:MAG TPA: hypothetical protein VEV17_26320 [Bryobacteraceae bacterium]|nr:hypothetical protein [Bryobacteraceae bacterium]
MEVKIQKHVAATAFEYFLYLALVLETGLAAFIYKVISPEPELLRLRIGLAVLYFGFLGWGVFQLSRVQRARKQFQSMIQSEVAAQPDPQIETAEAPVESPHPGRRIFGLTAPQFVVVLIVFVTAVLGFSWALAHLGRQ